MRSQKRTDVGISSRVEMRRDKEVMRHQKMIRDEELSDAFVKEELDRWERFLDLSLEEALASTKGMQQIVEIANTHAGDFSRRLLDMEDGMALLLAILGRGGSRCNNVNMMWGRTVVASEAIALCANLKSNTNIKTLNLRGQRVFGTTQICAILSTALTANNTLTDLGLDDVGMTPVALRCLLFGGGPRCSSSWHPTNFESDLVIQVQKSPTDSKETSKLKNKIKMEIEKLESGGGLLVNTALEALALSFNKLFDITALVVFVSKNPSLKTLVVYGDRYDFHSAREMTYALKLNTTLERLGLLYNKIGYDGAKLIFETLSRTIEDIPTKPSRARLKNTTLKRLAIGNMRKSLSTRFMAVEPFASMLETNTSLHDLCIQNMAFKTEHWTDHILPALSKNRTLESLDLQGCERLTGDEVCNALLSLIQDKNTGLKRIDLTHTGMAEWQGRVDDELRKNAEYRERLSNQSMVMPTSGRLVLCGYQFAGKTTIRNTLERKAKLGSLSEDLFKAAWKRLMRAVPCLHQILFGTDAPRELDDRTRGFDILVIDSGPRRTCVWDFAGQREYYALHDYLFPDVKNSCFVYVSSCRCPPDDQNVTGKVKPKEKMKDEFHFWMRFIASNSTVRPLAGAESSGIQLPYVHFVLTNMDTVSGDQQDLCEQWAQSLVDDMKQEFQGVIELCETVSALNAHSDADVQKLLDTTNFKLQEMLNNPSEYAICKEVRIALEEWSAQNSSNPVMHLRDFHRVCEDNIRVRPEAVAAYMDANLYDEEGQMAILAYLNDMGDIIYPKGLDFIVVNPRWFGTEVLGHLIDVVRGAGSSSSQMTASKWKGFFGEPKPSWKIDHENGFVSRKNIRKLLGHSLKSLEMQDVVTGISDDMLIHLMIKLEMCFEEVPENEDSRLFLPALFDDDTEGATKGERRLMWTLDDGTVYLGRRLQCKDKATTFLTPGFFPRLQVNLVNYMRRSKLVDNELLRVDRNLIEFMQNGKQVFVEYSGDIDYFIDIMVRSCKSHSVTLQFVEEHLVKMVRQLCASPQGCQGVILEEAVIRPLCVQDLHVCTARKGHSVLVSDLRNKIEEEGQDYEHQWQRIGSERCRDYALDLLEGEGSYSAGISSTTTSGHGRGDQQKSSSGDQLPGYYLSIRDLGMQSKLNALMKASKLMPFKIHLFCDMKVGSSSCKVEGQPGRDIKLDYAGHGSDLSLLKPVIKFLWGKFGLGFSIDEWINKFFEVGDIPNIDKKTLQDLINTSETSVPISEDDIVKALEDHIAHTPGRLKKILNVEDELKFSQDFRLQRVEYLKPDGKIVWLCKNHYESAFKQKLLKTNR